MARIDIDVYHEHISQVADDPTKDVSSGEWNHSHTIEEGTIPLSALTAAAQAGAARTTAEYTTGTLANGATDDTHTITMTKGYRLLHIETSREARVRLYVSSTQRTNDASRVAGVDPTGNHGVVLDFITTSGMLEADLCPSVDGFCDSGSIPVSITNLGSSGTVQLTLTYKPTEV